jgi:hypothetical protein
MKFSIPFETSRSFEFTLVSQSWADPVFDFSGFSEDRSNCPQMLTEGEGFKIWLIAISPTASSIRQSGIYLRTDSGF